MAARIYMKADTKTLWRAILGNAMTACGYVSTAATFLPQLTVYRLYLWSLSGALILIGAFRGALKVIAAKNGEITAREEETKKIEFAHAEEVRNLGRQIQELQRDPFDEEVKTKVKSELGKFDEKERGILKILLQFEPWDHNKLMPGLTCSVQEQSDVFRKGYGTGLLMTEDVIVGGQKRAHYKSRPQYHEALKKYLYETPRGLENLKNLKHSQ
jgi:hypothetical protein